MLPAARVWQMSGMSEREKCRRPRLGLSISGREKAQVVFLIIAEASRPKREKKEGKRKKERKGRKIYHTCEARISSTSRKMSSIFAAFCPRETIITRLVTEVNSFPSIFENIQFTR